MEKTDKVYRIKPFFLVFSVTLPLAIIIMTHYELITDHFKNFLISDLDTVTLKAHCLIHCVYLSDASKEFKKESDKLFVY